VEQTWRWFGPEDAITLPEIRQTGATGIVTALHHIPYGVVWSVEEIQKRKAMIEAEGLRWAVVESVPVAEPIKLGGGDLAPLYENYRQTLRNLAACGIDNVCYNFMPILDWTRTQLRHPLATGGSALKFNAFEYAAFDVYMLERPGAEAEHSPEVLKQAKAWFDAASESDKDKLLACIMSGLPGAYERYDVPGLKRVIDTYAGITADDLRRNFATFLKEIIPTAEEVGVRMGVHPDDPPRPIFGLPRVVSNEDDLAFIVGAVDSVANGLTLCTGSLGAGPTNDLPRIARRFAHRIQFVHLRNVTKEPDGSFMEAEHLGGDVDMVAVVTAILEEQKRRKDENDPRWRIPFRPDHGHELLTDVGRKTHPGYPLVGRLRGLAEVRGVMTAVSSLRNLPV
jgi:mannonate dehydratase